MTVEPGPKQCRAVVALTPFETNIFFPDVAKLRALLPEARWFDPAKQTADAWHALLAEVRPAVIVSAWNTPRLPETDVGLDYVCQITGSVRHLIPRSLMAAGLRVTNWGDTAAKHVAEHALLLILGALRSLPNWPGSMHRPFTLEEKVVLGTRSLFGRRVALHGFGRIARELITLLRPFNVTLTAYSAGVPDDYIRGFGVQPVQSLLELAADADVLVTCEALTEQTRHSIDRAVLASLAPGAVFVNVGRGAIVDEAALVAVAEERGLRVAVDVYETEPPAFDSPLFSLKHLIASPHIAGPTGDGFAQCGEIALSNLRSYGAGQPLSHVIDLAAYDRST